MKLRLVKFLNKPLKLVPDPRTAINTDPDRTNDIAINLLTAYVEHSYTYYKKS